MSQHVRIFYTLIQCLHHLSLMTQQLNGEVTSAFTKKHKHLNDFIKPANSGPQIKKDLDQINRDWVQKTTQKLVEHYSRSVTYISDHISSLALSPSDRLNCMSIALQQAKTHFGRKLQASTIHKFQNYFQKSPAVSTTTQARPKPNTTTNTQNKNSPKPNNTTNTQSKNAPNSSPQTRNIQGHKDPLSNFFPCNISFDGFRFRSLEHLYQYNKAIYHDCQHIARQIVGAPHAGVAKSLSKQIPSLSPAWFKYQTTLMVELFRHKFDCSKIFRDTLMALPKECRLVHTVPCPFWGVGRDGYGRDMFGHLLNTFRLSKHPKPNNPLPKSTSPPRPKPVSPQPTPVSTHNRFHSLTNTPPPPTCSPSPNTWSSPNMPSTSTLCPNIWPTLPITIPSPSHTNSSSTPLRRPRSPSDSPSNLSPSLRPKGKRTKFVSPKATPAHSFHAKPVSHKSNLKSSPKSNWTIPHLTKSTVVLGDSNISCITRSPTEDIQLEAFHGANFSHFKNMITKIPTSGIPKSIILGVGLNNRNANPSSTSCPDMLRMVSAFSKHYPLSKIYLPKINFSPRLKLEHQNNLNTLNNNMDTIKSRFSNVFTIPQLGSHKFRINRSDTDNIHWTADTANAMLKLWISHLN